MDDRAPIEMLMDFLGGLFSGGDDKTETANRASTTMEWDPLEAGHIIVRENPTPKAPPAGSIRSSLRGGLTERMVQKQAQAAAVSNEQTPEAVAARAQAAKSGKWTAVNPTWLALDDHQKAAVMSLMEADKADAGAAKNALATMVNRSQKTKIPLGTLVGSRAYQPSFEPSQEKRLDTLLKHPAFEELTKWAKSYDHGQEDDPTGGATHYLVRPGVMLALEAKEPRKYRSWRGWTGYDSATNSYRNQTMTDGSHNFLAPEGRYSPKRVHK